MAQLRRNLCYQFVNICVACVIFRSVGITGKVHSIQRDVHEPRTVDLRSSDWMRDPSLSQYVSHLGNRVRRNAPKDPPKRQMQVSETHLPHINHNEAIVHWSGKNSSTMFILTRERKMDGTVVDSALWRSTNYGSDFSPVTLPTLDKKIILDYYKLVFTDATNQILLRTTDEGVSFLNVHYVPVRPDIVQFHPTLDDSFLVYSEAERKLALTTDFGQSWEYIATEVSSRFYWAIPEIDQDLTTIHMEALDMVTGQSIYRVCHSPYSEEGNCKEPKELNFIDVDSLLVQNEYIFAQKSNQFYSHLYVSHKRGPFERAYFPGDMNPVDFSVVDSDQSQVFIAASHRSRIVNLYLSDVTGRYYITSLERIMALQKSEGGFDADLYEVHGQEGTYIVNSFDLNSTKTYISYDQGSHWHTLTPPLKYPNGTKISCHKSDDCRLHLHLQFSSYIYGYSFILSEANAPGMILAQGSLGSSLAEAQSDLFYSGDGGITWRMLYEGNYGFTIIDQGGAMVIIQLDSKRQSKEILYSCTEGHSFQTHTFKNQLLRVDGILNEPGISSAVVSIFGHDKDAGWTVIKLDFSSILSRSCTDADFDDWKPLDHLAQHQCLLGQSIVYKRRKPDSECLIGPERKNSAVITLCECTEEDYECDFGYTSENGMCVAASWFDPEEPSGKCPEGKPYMKSKGYRKIASDKCQNGTAREKYEPVPTECPVMSPRGLVITHGGTLSAAVESGKNISFELMQSKGSVLSTSYTWSFGDSSSNASFVGLTSASPVSHSFGKRGQYTISVTATNAKGSASASLQIIVEDKLKGMFIGIPRGAVKGQNVYFEAELLTIGPHTTELSHVHYLWSFGDEKIGEHPLLTWDRIVDHTFEEAGNYTTRVEAINDVGSVFRTFPVIVYGTMRIFELLFDPNTNRLKQDTVLGRQVFSEFVKRSLVQVLNEPPQRFEVDTLRGFTTTAIVSILPVIQTSTEDKSIDQIALKLQEKFAQRALEVNLTKADFGMEFTARVTSLADVTHERNSGSGGTNYVAVYVCVPLLLVAIFISVLIFIYYKRMMRCSRHRYSILHSRSQGIDDALLDDTDDDDPPLDPNPDLTNQRLALDDDDLADDPLGAHLMMGPGGRGVVNC
ncbi:hypothetical protein CAPTEDRAFT_202789 [Capitella teleta]|uniref:PKD domain-containing protein n=1 Tax=Capitella teleta TaxID=283909 RepID=R7USK0_CAPTE|nr:hypothetical protein CAPTEDRAFT_202789 [Capitella teleta]|eukprot:ELU09175.1 hypothetical protein CAPTEDRAFT_202789 [Capitella teleta]